MNLNRRAWVLVLSVLLGVVAFAVWGWVWVVNFNLKEPVSSRLRGEWRGTIEHEVLTDLSGKDLGGFILNIDHAPKSDPDSMMNYYVETTKLILAKWPDVGTGDDNRQFVIFTNEELAQGTTVRIKGEALIGQLVSQEKLPLSLKGEERGRLEFILRVRNITRAE